MENIYIKKVKNGFIVEVSPYGDEDMLYIYPTKEEMVAALPGHVDEAITAFEAEKAKKEAK